MLRCATFLAPNMVAVYEFITARLGDRLGCAAELVVGDSYDELDDVDVAFVCGLAYVERAEGGESSVEPIAAPLLQGQRYGGRPVYFSDVIVRRDSPFQTFADLRGRSWSYNEPHSHSGYGVTRYRLVQMGETNGYFGRVVQAGWHERSIQMVCDGAVDASAIDSQVLAVAVRDEPELGGRLRVIDTLGPSTIQPVVVSRRLPEAVKDAIQSELLLLGDDPVAQRSLTHGFIQRFVAVTDESYDDIRAMRDVAALCMALV
ncbi:MAG: PhnD/SsuA/transferrin family substrate-binding protein [Gemmataceae bacterium]|nr:PhnD/SsuA/transferrin family substrate-binding protein [Gemmataceae bacterium]